MPAYSLVLASALIVIPYTPYPPMTYPHATASASQHRAAVRQAVARYPMRQIIIAQAPSSSALTPMEENAGNGGNAFSGTSSGNALFSLVRTNHTSKVPVGSGFSGDDGETPGGSVDNVHPALIESDSDNTGHGGNASSGDSSGLVS